MERKSVVVGVASASEVQGWRVDGDSKGARRTQPSDPGTTCWPMSSTVITRFPTSNHRVHFAPRIILPDEIL